MMKTCLWPKISKCFTHCLQEKEKIRAVQMCVCVCTLALNQVTESNDSNFPPILPLSLSMPLFFIFVFRNGTISDIKKKKHTHTQLMARLCPCGWRNLEICEDRPRLKLTPEPGLVRDSLECDMTVSGAEQMEFLECFCWVPN